MRFSWSINLRTRLGRCPGTVSRFPTRFLWPGFSGYLAIFPYKCASVIVSRILRWLGRLHQDPPTNYKSTALAAICIVVYRPPLLHCTPPRFRMSINRFPLMAAATALAVANTAPSVDLRKGELCGAVLPASTFVSGLNLQDWALSDRGMRRKRNMTMKQKLWIIGRRSKLSSPLSRLTIFNSLFSPFLCHRNWRLDKSYYSRVMTPP